MTDPTPAEALKANYEARLCPGIPTDCCDYGVISHATGKEVCRVWNEEDARQIADLLNATLPSPATDAGEDVAAYIRSLSPEHLAAMMRVATGRQDYPGVDAGEVRRLREALIECGRAAGCLLADDVSNDFLMLVPTEVKAKLNLGSSFADGIEAAAKKLDEMQAEWWEQERRYRAAGNNGPYLGAPSYSNAAAAIRGLAR